MTLFLLRLAKRASLYMNWMRVYLWLCKITMAHIVKKYGPSERAW